MFKSGNNIQGELTANLPVQSSSCEKSFLFAKYGWKLFRWAISAGRLKCSYFQGTDAVLWHHHIRIRNPRQLQCDSVLQRKRVGCGEHIRVVMWFIILLNLAPILLSCPSEWQCVGCILCKWIKPEIPSEIPNEDFFFKAKWHQGKSICQNISPVICCLGNKTSCHGGLA